MECSYAGQVNSSDYLKLPNNVDLRLAIGLFHIHGHQATCLARYSPSFIKGGRQIDGETIEKLWAPLNEITRSTRGMSTSHHWEVIDDHMNDSNWKKLIDLGKFLFAFIILCLCGPAVNTVSRCYQKALLGATLSAAAFETINTSAKPESVHIWTAKEENAQRQRGHDVKVMDIYDIKMKQCAFG